MTRQLPFSVVTKPTGAACNLDCEYCFFLSKELLYNKARQEMSTDTLHRYVDRFVDASPDGEVTMLWQGGEPTLRGLPFFKEAVSYAEKRARPGQKILHALQTNGTLITEQWAEYLKEKDVLVGVSIDGPQEIHDAYRVNRARRGTHAQVIRGWNRLQKAGVRCNVLTTVHAANEKHGRRIYRYLRDELGAKHMQFIPIVERVPEVNLAAAERGWGRSNHGDMPRLLYRQNGHAVTSRSTTPKRYGAFLSAIFDEWVRRDVGEVFVQDFDHALSALFNIPTVCVHAPECGNNFAMEFNGDVYACDHWVEPDWLIGNIRDMGFDQLADTERMHKFARKKRKELTAQCRRCPMLKLCNGGCPKDRFMKSVDGEPGQNYLCAGYYAFYNHILPAITAMARLLNAGHAPAEIMDPRVRRQLGLVLPH